MTFQEIENAIPKLTREELLNLLECLVAYLKQQEQANPTQKLRGIHKDLFGPDFDVDSVIKEVRTSSEKELDDLL